MPAKKAEPTFMEQRAEYVALLHWYTEEVDKHILGNEKASDLRAASAARNHVRKSFPAKWKRMIELEAQGQGGPW